MTKRLNTESMTLAWLADNGWQADIVSRRTGPVARDLFGFIDILAVQGQETLAIQCTSASNVAARVRKITESDMLPAVRDAGWSVQVWGWREGEYAPARVVDLS